MVEILTLFLGLVTGPQTVELEVRPEVAEVEVLLDGRPVGRLTSPPWRLEVDLGEALLPHELVALARDGAGRELARARRWINIDLPRVEIAGRAPPGGLTPLPVVFDAGPEPAPEEMAGWFRADGAPLAVSAVQTGPAEVIVVQDPATRRSLEEMARVFLAWKLTRLGFPVEPPRADSPAWDPELLQLPEAEFRRAAKEAFGMPGGVAESRQIGLLWRAWQELAALGDETTVRFLSPLAAPVSRSERQRNLFVQSAAIADVGLFWLAETMRPMSFAHRFADAVAIAGREAHAGGRRRAVLLLLDGEPSDDSLYRAAAVRAYLRALRVPLFVWTLSPTGALEGWGETRFIGFRTTGRARSIRAGAIGESFERFSAAAAELRRAVDDQRIVWLGGEHLPHRIDPTANEAGARPAGIALSTTDRGSTGRRRRRGAAGGAAR